AAAREVRASRTWTGLAGSGRMALIDHRDAAEAGLRVLTDPVLWGAHHDLTGPTPMSWPEALELLSAELGEPLTFRGAAGGRVPGAVPGSPHRRRGSGGGGRAAHRARVGDPRRRERLHDRDLPADHRPPPAPGGRVPSRVPRGIRLMPARHPHPIHRRSDS